MQNNSSDDEGTFTVEVILAARVAKVSKKRKRSKKRPKFEWEYEVKWAGYDDEANTWEPPQHLGGGCDGLLQRFWKQFEMDNRDYPEGYECRAPAEWIEKEKKKFQVDSEKEKRKQKSPGSSKLPEADEAEEPIAEPSSISEIKRKPGKKKKATALTSATQIEPAEESDSEDSDEPLSKKRKRLGTPTLVKSKNKTKVSKSKSKSQEATASPAISEAEPPPLPPVRAKKRKSTVANSPKPLPQPQPTAAAGGPSLFSDDEELDDVSLQQPQVSANAPVSTPTPPLPPPVHHRAAVASRPAKDVPPQSLKGATTASQPPKGPSVGIDTKKRLGRDALQPVAPQKKTSLSHPRATQPDRIVTGSSSVMSTGFRSTIQTPITARPRDPEPTLASLNLRETPPPVAIGADDFNDTIQQTGASPADIASKEDPFHISPSHENEMQIDTPIPPQVPPQEAFAKKADDFLASIEIPGPSTKPHPLGPVLPPKRLHIKKKWRWEGSLLAALAPESDVEFKVVMTDEVELKATGFTFSIALGNQKELRLARLYDSADLGLILPACQPPAYYCHIELQDSASNSEAWVTLGKYMAKRRQVALIPFHLGENLIGHALIHSPSINPLGLDKSVFSSTETTLVACFLPWTLTPEQLACEPVLVKDIVHENRFTLLTKQFDEIKKLYLEKDAVLWKGMVHSRPLLQYALRTVGMQSDLYEYLLLKSSRTWSIMPPNETVRNGFEDLDGRLLKEILKRIEKDSAVFRDEREGKKATVRQAGKGSSAGMIFIHVGALCQLPSYQYFLRALLQTSSYTRFYTYGTHPKIPSSFWGVQEIYPYGGVVTVTPSAFLHHPLQVIRKLKALAENPMWVVYILPSVLGMLAAISNVTEVAKFPFPYLLKAIAQGEVAMLQAPPDTTSWYGRNDQRQAWLRNYIQGRPLKPEEALSQGNAAFHSRYANNRPTDWEAMVENEVTADLKRMQYQPALVTHYRRFVVLSGTKPTKDQETSIEWMLPGDFAFRDKFPS